MKKLAAVVAAILAVSCLTISISAAEFTPSVQGKEAPDTVTVKTKDGKDAAALIKDKNGNEVQGITADDLVVTSVAKANGSGVPTEVSANLKAAYEQIGKAATLDKLVPNIADVLDKLPGKPAVKDLAVRDLFDVSLEGAEDLLKGGQYIDICFKVGIAKNDTLLCLHNVSGTEWEVIDPSRVVNNGDGTVTVSFNSLSPIAFAVKTSVSPEDPDVPVKTGDTGISPAVLWVGAAALAVLVAMAVLEVRRNKGKKTAK